LEKTILVQRVVDETGVQTFKAEPSPWRSVALKESTWSQVREGMRRVVKSGTGQACNIPYLDVRGKTGTAQNPHGEDHAWFGAFAGYAGEEPSVALCVFVENGGHGGVVAAAIARPMLEKALPPRTPPAEAKS
jgi:cell division protein FtsI/penicillin-binding protein 2